MTVVVRDEFSAEQTGVKKVTATGSDLTNVTSDYVLKRGSVTIDLDTITLSEDKTSAVIASKASRLTAGEYTLQFKDKDPVKFTVEEGRITAIDIPNDTLPLDSDLTTTPITATIGYKVYNQFNEDVTKTVSTVNATSSFGTANANINDSNIKINFPGTTAPLVGTTGTIVIVDTASGINFSKTLTLGMKAKADSIEVLGVYNSATGEKMEIKENSTNANAALLVKVKDQYGGEMSHLNCAAQGEVAFTFTGGLTNITVTTSQDFTDTITVDGDTCVIIPLNASSSVKTGTAQAFFVSTSTGKTANASITVGSNATVRSIDVYPIDQVYGGKENEFGFTALTEEGTEVKDYDTLSNTQYGLNSISSTYGSFSWRKNSDGTAKLIYSTSGNPDFATAIGNGSRSVVASATFVTAGYGTKTITFTVYAPSVPTSIGGIKDVTLGLLNTTATTSAVKFTPKDNLVIYDQYGNSMDKNDYGNYKVQITPVDASATTNDTIVTRSAVNGTNGVIFNLTGASIEYSATSGAISGPYTERYTATLINPTTNETVPGSSYTFAVSTAPMSSLTRFTMDTVPALYDFTTDTTGKFGKGTHMTAPSVTGYTAANIAISIPNDKLTLTPGSGLSVVTESAVELGSTAVKSSFSASGAAASYITKENQNAVTRETNITVTVDNTAGTRLTQTLNVSSVAPAATTIGAYSSVKVASSAGIDGVLTALTYSVKDQYGKDYNGNKITAKDTNTIQVSNITDADGKGFSVTKNNTPQASITGANTGDTFVITVTLKSGTVITAVVTIQ